MGLVTRFVARLGSAGLVARFLARRSPAGLVVGLLLVAPMGVAQAQSQQQGPQSQEQGPRSQEKEQSFAEKTKSARALFRTALQRIQSGRFAEARDLLEESLELVPRVGTAFNLAVANRGTGDLLTALELLQQLLDEQFGELSAAQREEASALQRELTAQIGRLKLTLQGAPRAEVRVDGDRAGEVEEGGVPLSIAVNPGRRIVTLSAQDYEDEERSVRVEPGAEIPLAFRMALTEDAKTGRLIVDAANPNDRIEIVGVAVGRGHLEERVTPGTYAVRVSNERGSKKTTLTVRPRGTVRFQFDDLKTPLFKRPLFWAGAGAVVAGAALAVFLTRPQPKDEAPVTDPTYDVVEARLRWR